MIFSFCNPYPSNIIESVGQPLGNGHPYGGFPLYDELLYCRLYIILIYDMPSFQIWSFRISESSTCLAMARISESLRTDTPLILILTFTQPIDFSFGIIWPLLEGVNISGHRSHTRYDDQADTGQPSALFPASPDIPPPLFALRESMRRMASIVLSI